MNSYVIYHYIPFVILGILLLFVLWYVRADVIYLKKLYNISTWEAIKLLKDYYNCNL